MAVEVCPSVTMVCRTALPTDSACENFLYCYRAWDPARVGGRDELAQGHEQQRGVKHVGVVVLDERSAVGDCEATMFSQTRFEQRQRRTPDKPREVDAELPHHQAQGVLSQSLCHSKV